MQFEDSRLQETHEAVGRYLGELFDDTLLDPENGHYYVAYGTTILEVSIEQLDSDEPVVLITAYCVQGVSVDAELALGLLDLNHELPIGAFSLVESDIFFQHALFARSLDRHNLLGAITAVATTADDYDERIIQKYGGSTARDRIRQTGGRERRRAARAD